MTDDPTARAVSRLGLAPDAVVQVLGWQDDGDTELLSAVENRVAEVIMTEAEDVVDAVLLWWRDDDGDLADGLLDAVAMLHAEGTIWLLTPRFGRPGYMAGADVSEAVHVAGLQSTSSFGVGPGWQAARLSGPRRGAASR